MPLPQEAWVSANGEAFAEHIQQIHEGERAALKANNEAYVAAANQHQWIKDVEVRGFQKVIITNLNQGNLAHVKC